MIIITKNKNMLGYRSLNNRSRTNGKISKIFVTEGKMDILLKEKYSPADIYFQDRTELYVLKKCDVFYSKNVTIQKGK
jgi:hypothetical protein